jgi:Extensin-like protein C-terminus
MSRPPHVFEKLAGVPVHYDRLAAPFGYGTRGKPMKFHSGHAFAATLEQCLQELWELCPLGRADVITSAGAWVEKPGYHGHGRAFDLDGIFWVTKSFVTRYDGFEGGDRTFYHAVEAVLRRHFGTVLDYHYNADHRDHFHLDDGTAVDFQASSPSRVKFLQGALTYVHGWPLTVDGAYGPQTQEAVATVLHELGITGDLHHPPVWGAFLRQTAQRGFGAVAPAPAGPVAEKTPLELLHDVYAVIDQTLMDTGLRKQVEGVLTAFVNHDDTQSWLEHYRVRA